MLKKFALIIYSIYCYLLFWLMGMVTVLYLLLILAFASRKKKGEYLYWWIWWYSEIFGWLVGVRYKVTGRENFQKNTPYVVTSNHNAVSDMFIMVNAMRGINYRPLSKIELSRVPMFGFLWRHTLVFVDRKSPESRHKSIHELEKLITRENISVLIFPEGTRNRTANPLKEFYDGAFRIAIECKVPVIPMVMINTKGITPQNTWIIHPGLLECHFLPPVFTEGLTEADVPALKDKVYKMMQQVLLEQ